MPSAEGEMGIPQDLRDLYADPVEVLHQRNDLLNAMRSIAGKRRPSGAFCQRVAKAALENIEESTR
jgi:hypothetical protein